MRVSPFGYTQQPESQRLVPFPRQMAVKSARLCDSGSLQSKKPRVRWLQNEKRVLSILHRNIKCPYIIQCFGDEYPTGENGEKVYNLLLEYASGGSLHDQIMESHRYGLPESDVRLYARSILCGIKHVHDCGFVHLDIKPGNILLFPLTSRRSGSTKFMEKVCDYGLARRARVVKSGLRGDTRYLSLEAVTDRRQEAPSDVWAIGCVVLELLTDSRVWLRESYWGIEEIANKIGHGFGTPGSPGEISQEGKEFLKGCFERKAEDRLTVDMLKLPFVSDIVIKAEKSEPGEVMDENYDKESMYYDVTYCDESSY